GDRVVLISARHVDVGGPALEALDLLEGAALQLELAPPTLRLANERGRDEGDRGYRNHARHPGHEVARQLLEPPGGFLLRERTAVDAPLARPVGEREGRTEVHAGVAEAIPAAARPEPRVAAQEDQHVRDCARGARALRVRLEEKAAVLEGPVVVDADRHERD